MYKVGFTVPVITCNCTDSLVQATINSTRWVSVPVGEHNEYTGVKHIGAIIWAITYFDALFIMFL